jgi:hypothetical protein
MLAACEAVIESLLIIDEKRRRLLDLEWRQAAELPPGPFQGNFAGHDLADGQAGTDLIE